MVRWHSIRLIVMIALITKETFSSLLKIFSRCCTWLVCGIWYISRSKKKTDRKVTLFHTSPAFRRVQCGSECDMITWVTSHSYQYPWGSKLPPEASSEFIWICIHWPMHKYSQYLLETSAVSYRQKGITRGEPTRGSLSPISPDIDEWSAITLPDFTASWLGSTRGIMVRCHSVHLNGLR